MLCFHSAGEVTTSGSVTAAPFRCRSWRCRRCSWEVAREDYRRVEHAACSRGWWLYVVLTFDPSQWSTPWECYLGASKLWNDRLSKVLSRQYGRIEYLQTWERTRRGWPHMNLLLRSSDLEDEVKKLPDERRFTPEGDHGRGRLAHWTAWRRWMTDAAPRAGFGKRVWVEIVDSRESMAAYLVKVAQEFSRSAFKDGDQRPLGAPPHFRRLRASRGLLPKRMRVVSEPRVDRRTGKVTWVLRERPMESKGPITAVLANVPLATFEERKPGWTDVAEARFRQYAADRRRVNYPPTLARIEYER
jgi:hypothetical protein